MTPPYSWIMNHLSWTRWRSSVWKPQRLVWSCCGPRLSYRISVLAHLWAPSSLTTSLDVESVEQYIYQGNQQGPNGYCRSDMIRRNGLASAVTGSLQWLWKCSSLSQQTKVHLYHALVMSVLMYGAETCSLTAVDLGKLESFHMRYQHQLLNIHWSSHVTNESLRELTGLFAIDDDLSGRRLCPFLATLHHWVLWSLQTVPYD